MNERVGTLEGALRFGSDAKHLSRRYAAKGRKSDFEGLALKALRRLVQ